MISAPKSVQQKAAACLRRFTKPIDDLVNVGKITALPLQCNESTAKLITEIETAIGETNSKSNFSPVIEEHYNDATKAVRQNFFVVMNIMGLFVYNLFLIPDFLIMPDLLPLIAFLQLCVVTPVAILLIAAVVRMKIDSNAPGLIILLTMLTAALIGISVSRSENIAIYVFALPLFILGGNILVAISFKMAALFTAYANIAIACVLIFHHTISFNIAIFLILVIATTSSFSLIANYRINTGLRSAYLHALIERLRAQQLATANQHLASLVAIDGLTGLNNRRSFDAKMADLWSCANASGQVALLMIDIDHFKNLNDTHGHLGGDECIRQVAQLLLAAQHNPNVLVARYGGEEFAVIINDSNLEEAYRFAEKIRAAIERHDIVLDDGRHGIHLTVSIGCASIVPSEQSNPSDLCSAADAALYEAKKSGRNQTRIASLSHPIPWNSRSIAFQTRA